MPKIGPDNQRPIIEDLLAFPVADSMLVPVFYDIMLVPVETGRVGRRGCFGHDLNVYDGDIRRQRHQNF